MEHNVTHIPFSMQQFIRKSLSDGVFLCLKAAMLPKIHYTKINITFVEKFGPVFATEGESATLSATMTLNPNLANLQPEAQWYRDGKY